MEHKVRNGRIDLKSDETRKKKSRCIHLPWLGAINYKLLFETFSYLLTQECCPVGKIVSHVVSRLLN